MSGGTRQPNLFLWLHCICSHSEVYHLSKACLADKDKELVALKCHTKHGRNPLKVPVGPLVQLLENCERLFRANEDSLVNSKCTVEKKICQRESLFFQNFSYLPRCCRKSHRSLFLCRLHFADKQRNVYVLDKMRQSGKCGSKSAGMLESNAPTHVLGS